MKNEDYLNTDYTCPVCAELLIDTETTKTHIKLHDIQELYFRNTNLFKKIIEYTIDINNLECQLCLSNVRTNSGMVYHYSKHMGDFSVFLDRDINKRFKHLKETLEKNVDNEAPQAPSRYLKTNYVEGERTHPCAMCDGIYKNLDGLNCHISQRHSNRQESKICELCGATLSNKRNLAHHMKIHNNVRDFNCADCGKAFRSRDALALHVRTHTGEKPYKCEYCNKTFRVQTHLGIHRKTHTGERKHRCYICDRGFIQPVSLRVHLVSCKKKYYS